MTASSIAWSYAATTYLSLLNEKAPITAVPRLVCSTLLFLRASHEAHAEEADISKSDLGKPDHVEMVEFVRYAKNAIIHGPERISLVAGEAIAPPEGIRLAFRVQDYQLEFEGPDAYEVPEDQLAAAKEYANRNSSRGVAGGLLAVVRDAIIDTADLISIPADQRERFERAPFPVIL